VDAYEKPPQNRLTSAPCGWRAKPAFCTPVAGIARKENKR
jgi:hypothetical protein